ncbi:MAG: DsbA family protein [Candidatus Moranbacteria bacterium]|nr:DsbA family protein [Candidatus Moranbacteria bacterium]
METLFSEKTEAVETDRQKARNLAALAVLLAGLFVGGLFVDFGQLLTGQGFSGGALRDHAIVETAGKVWVSYDEPKVEVQVITDENCIACDPSEALLWLRRVIPTLEASPVDGDSELGRLLVARFQIKSLPAFIFSENIEETDFFAQASSLFEKQDERYFFDMGKIGLPVGKYLQLPRIDDTDIILGVKDAPVKIVEFADFQCPYCRAFHLDIERLLKEYEGKVTFVYKHLPLSFHNQAENAALAAFCAHDQGKFRQYAALLFAKQEEWSKTSGVQAFKNYAWRLGLQNNQFATCLDTKKYLDKVNADQLEAAQFSIGGTPGTFVNGTFLSGAVGFETLKKAVEDELAK